MKIFPLLVAAFLAGDFSHTSPPIALKGYFHCAGAVIEGTGKAFSCYALTQSSCRNGTAVLAYEQMVKKIKGQPVYRIVDTVNVKVNSAKHALSITRCVDSGGQPRSYFVLTPLDQPGQHLSGIQRAWTYNAKDELVEVSLRMTKCLNNDYGAE